MKAGRIPIDIFQKSNNIQQNNQLYNQGISFMSQSSLPDIFKKSVTVHKRVSKQGPSFSVHLAAQSPQKYLSSRVGYDSGENKYATLNYSKSRSLSMQQVKLKQSVFNEFNTKKNGDDSSKIKVNFRDDLDFRNSLPLRQKVPMSITNWPNFPYETSCRFNNSLVYLEETENLQGKIQSLSNEVNILHVDLQSAKQLNSQCRKSYFQFCQKASQDLDNFALNFQDSLKQCYCDLSSLRRQTNGELKASKLDFERLRGDMDICSSFTNDIQQKTNEMFTEYLKISQNEGQDQHPTFKKDQNFFDFQEISSIKKSSRGATGDISRRTKRTVFARNIQKTDDLQLQRERENDKFVLNGKQIDLLNFEEEC